MSSKPAGKQAWVEEGRGDTAAGAAPTTGDAAVHNGKDGALDSQAPDATSFANYFCEYAYLYHQMDMLEDQHRTGTYYSAIISNPKSFEGKVVLDVGAGSGILSIMAARAGAGHVYAVEATDMAQRARMIVAGNGLSSKITVIQGTVETVKLPCKVDVIISEWMGYFLLRESMLDSVLVARDKFLKPGGALFPSHATLYLAPLGNVKELSDKYTNWQGEKQHWANFAAEMKDNYETDFACVKDEFLSEQRKYFLQTGTFANLTPKALRGTAKPLLEIDLAKVSLSELQDPKVPLVCQMRVVRDGPLDGFCGYFDTAFSGSDENEVEQPVTLSTAPTTGTQTHWGQQMFGFYPPIVAKRNDIVEITLYICRQKHNPRLLHLPTTVVHKREKDGVATVLETREEQYYVD